MGMTRLKTILNKYKETRMAYRTGKPKIRMMLSMQESQDMVNHPPHYTQGGMETIDYMEAKSTPEEFAGHLRLTAIKYLSRAGLKESTLMDLKKAQWYVNELVTFLEKQTVKSK
jgi:lipoate-protein ligase B